ncbi:MAG: hypothetical protein ETSY1_14615 [Candidatus Entotheonella factor]|uniref:SpoVT-AbrB domain-containing protein n=1 Tax=Entotheonella factor TaxID=1429438 RepID=W4LQ39_ENTF1|nr:MAG: hypothetical protein ETSY1_14615 [Candidatus Entotheonella factor]
MADSDRDVGCAVDRVENSDRISIMDKVTDQLQITIPQSLVNEFGIVPGDEMSYQSTGDAIRIVPKKPRHALDLQTRLALFDQATERQATRQRKVATAPIQSDATDRGWTRENLYHRGRAD